jgi:hypothetical protein
LYQSVPIREDLLAMSKIPLIRFFMLVY